MSSNNVLIVDDEEMVAELVEAIVKRVCPSAVITRCANKDQALKAIRASSTNGNAFDLEITDFKIPNGEEGLEIAELTRSLTPTTRIIVMSGTMDEVHKVYTPADYYLKKPFYVEEATEMITLLLYDMSVRR